MSNLIGGGGIPGCGGWINVNPLNTDGTISTSQAGQTTIDVRYWIVHVMYREKELSISGLLGCPAARRTACQYRFEMEIMYDPNNPPELLFRPKSGFSLTFLVGTDFMNDGLPRKQWFSPLSRIEQISPKLNALDHKLVIQKVEGISLTHMFLLPDDQLILTPYQTYLNSIKTVLMR